jgi:hypothetical protein
MQNLQISDYAANQLNDLAEQEHISSSDIRTAHKKHSQELAKRKELKAFLSLIKKT